MCFMATEDKGMCWFDPISQFLFTVKHACWLSSIKEKTPFKTSVKDYFLRILPKVRIKREVLRCVNQGRDIVSKLCWFSGRGDIHVSTHPGTRGGVDLYKVSALGCPLSSPA